MTAALTRKDQITLERDLCTRNFSDFVARAWKEVDTKAFVSNWHIKVICDHMQAVFEGRATPRLLINVPPGAAKSLICSVMYPAWCWTRDPTYKVISTAHNMKLAERDSKKCRRLIMSHWYQVRWPTQVRDDQDAIANFANTSGGERIAMALSSMTGERGSCILIDDAHTVKGARSAVQRQETVDTFLETVPSRLNDPENDSIIVIMQRLHEEDVAGAILSRPDLGYDHLCLPLFADGVDRPATSIGWIDPRIEGENLFPKRYTDKFIREQKASLGPFAFSGQYQQDPVPSDDGFFKREWFHRYRVHATEDQPSQLPAHLHYYMTSDHAPSGKGDWNVVRIWGVDHRRNLYLVDSFRKKCLMDECLGVVRDPATGKASLALEGALPLIRKYKPLGWYPENDPTWSAIKSFVTAAMIETQVFCRIDPLPLKNQGDKVGKAGPYQALASMGMVHLPTGQIGDVALEEYVKFGPTCKHDDQVDADGAIARVLADAIPAMIPVPQAEKRWDELAHEPVSTGWY